jgi:hypothetical protein
VKNENETLYISNQTNEQKIELLTDKLNNTQINIDEQNKNHDHLLNQQIKIIDNLNLQLLNKNTQLNEIINENENLQQTIQLLTQQLNTAQVTITEQHSTIELLELKINHLNNENHILSTSNNTYIQDIKTLEYNIVNLNNLMKIQKQNFDEVVYDKQIIHHEMNEQHIEHRQQLNEQIKSLKKYINIHTNEMNELKNHFKIEQINLQNECQQKMVQQQIVYDEQKKKWNHKKHVKINKYTFKIFNL